jgi:hypothetical protein
MKQVLGLIHFPPSLSRSVARVRDFRRCPEHDNVLAYEGRALSVDEFNRVAPKLLGEGKGLYGVQPIAKLVEVEVAESAPVEAPAAKPLRAAKPAPVIDLPKVTLEPSGDGFVLVNYEGDEACYMGASQAWESDVSLVIPFASEDEARAACPGVLVDKAPAIDEPDESLAEDSGASPMLVEESAPAPQEPVAQPSPPAVDPANIRNTVMKAQAAKRAAKAARNAPAPKKVTPPPAAK